MVVSTSLTVYIRDRRIYFDVCHEEPQEHFDVCLVDDWLFFCIHLHAVARAVDACVQDSRWVSQLPHRPIDAHMLWIRSMYWMLGSSPPLGGFDEKRIELNHVLNVLCALRRARNAWYRYNFTTHFWTCYSQASHVLCYFHGKPIILSHFHAQWS